jgi:capsular exopolysaccharide synthesis family protein
MSKIYDAMKRAAGESQEDPATEETKLSRIQPPDVPSSEEYHRLTQGLIASSADLQVVLVVSAVQSEGASTVARNMAKVLSESNPTVLLDANLRAPSQHTAFGVEPRPGLIDLVDENAVVDEILRNGSTPGLSLLTCGGPIERGLYSMSADAVRHAVDNLMSRFRWIVIDGPPVTLYSEAVSLAGISDGVILVIQADRTRGEVVEQAKRVLEDGGARILGAVLNRRKHHIPQFIYKRL